MGGCIGACAGSFAASCCATLCGCGATKSRAIARLLYFALIAYATIIALCLKYWLQPSSLHWMKSNKILQDDDGICSVESNCFPHQIVYRMSFASVLLFAVLLVIDVFGPRLALWGHRSCFTLKFLSIPAVWVASLWISNEFFNGFAWGALFVSLLFLITQAIALIDFAYSWNEGWVAKAESSEGNGGKFWIWGILGSAGSLTIASFSLIVIGCLWYPDGGSRALLVVNFLIGLALMGLSVSEWCEHGALLTSSVVLFDVILTTFFAISSSPKYDDNASESTWHLIIGMLLAALSIGWTSISLAGRVDMFHLVSRDVREDRQIDREADEDQQARQQEAEEGGRWGDDDGNGNTPPQRKETSSPSQRADTSAVARPSDQWDCIWFHFILLVSSFYLAMLATGWRSRDSRTPHTGWASFWVQTSAAWSVLLLYLWTLIAPKLMPNRDFS